METLTFYPLLLHPQTGDKILPTPINWQHPSHPEKDEDPTALLLVWGDYNKRNQICHQYPATHNPSCTISRTDSWS